MNYLWDKSDDHKEAASVTELHRHFVVKPDGNRLFDEVGAEFDPGL